MSRRNKERGLGHFGTLYFPPSAGLLAEVDHLRLELDSAVARCDEGALSGVVGRLQHCMLQVREVGNLKLEVSSQLLDTVSNDTAMV